MESHRISQGECCLKIFIADDSQLLCERLSQMLKEQANIEVIGMAHQAQDAIEQICRLKPDLVVLDIRMPKGNGIHVLKEIKARIPDLKVMMFTNFPFPQYREKCHKYGADFFFEKSTEYQNLVEEIVRLEIVGGKE